MNLRRTGGFTLLEVMIASTLLGVVVGGIFGALISANKFPRPEIERALHVNIIREKLERLSDSVRQDQWDVAGTPLAVGAGPQENIDLDGVTYTRGYQVAAVAQKDYRRVSVRVTTP